MTRSGAVTAEERDAKLCLAPGEPYVDGAPCCECWLDARHILFGDTEGRLVMLELVCSGGDVVQLVPTLLGRVSMPSALCPLAVLLSH